jgi:4-hydroxythreonine-4-phosphate dehydrogenase
MGDPGGIGPEVALKAVCDRRVRAVCKPVLFGDAALLEVLATELRLPVRFAAPAFPEPPARRVHYADLGRVSLPGRGFDLVDTGGADKPPVLGKPSKHGGMAAGRAIEEAVVFVGSGKPAQAPLRGLVTAPVSKQSLALAGYGMIGHTELFAKKTKTRRYAMMMKNGELRVVFATTHVPLHDVARRITSAELVAKFKLAYEYLVWYTWLKRPRIAVCGLNPHCGEGGMLGKEEKTVIGPAVRRAKRLGIPVEGPLAADSVFRPDQIIKYHAIVVMYHDQGIIPVKMGDPGRVINITLGIPFVRTSPGHGTAFDIAGKGIASAESMVNAIIECAEMADAPPAVRRAGRGRRGPTTFADPERMFRRKVKERARHDS